MKNLYKNATIFAVTLGLFGCVTVKNLDIDTAAKNRIKTVLVRKQYEPAVQIINLGSAALAIPFVGPSIERETNEKNSREYRSRMHEDQIELGSDLVNAVSSLLKTVGYQMVYLKETKTTDSQTPDSSTNNSVNRIDSDAPDASLYLSGLSAGYTSSNTSITFSPRFFVTATLIDNISHNEIYHKRFTCGADPALVKNLVYIPADSKFQYSNFKTLIGSYPESIEGLRGCIRNIAAHIANDLRHPS